jgi:hypothetical protein
MHARMLTLAMGLGLAACHPATVLDGQVDEGECDGYVSTESCAADNLDGVVRARERCSLCGRGLCNVETDACDAWPDPVNACDGIEGALSPASNEDGLRPLLFAGQVALVEASGGCDEGFLYVVKVESVAPRPVTALIAIDATFVEVPLVAGPLEDGGALDGHDGNVCLRFGVDELEGDPAPEPIPYVLQLRDEADRLSPRQCGRLEVFLPSD